jgi:hypothetical protein
MREVIATVVSELENLHRNIWDRSIGYKREFFAATVVENQSNLNGNFKKATLV